MRNAMILIIIILSLAQSAAAERAVYFVVNVNYPDSNIKNTLQQIGHTVDLVDNEDISSVDWSRYDYMIIGDQVFQNEMDFPVNRFPALILNTNYMDEWHWSSRISQKTSSVPLKGYNNDPSSIITRDQAMEITLYGSSSPTVNYLHRYYRAPALKSVVSTSNASVWDTLNGIIVTAEPGTKLRDNFVSETKTVFYGITASQYWTPQSKKLLQQSAVWLTTDFYPPSYSEIQVSPLTNSTATISWKTDKLSTSGLRIDGRQYSAQSLSAVHQFTVSGLKEDTSYLFTLQGCNADGYCGESAQQSLKTNDYTPPKILSREVRDISNQSAVVEALIDETGYIEVFYGKTSSLLDRKTAESPIGTSGIFQLDHLSEKTTYYYRIQACDDSGNCRNNTVSSFRTLDYTAPSAPKDLVLSVNKDGRTIIASWGSPSDDATKWTIHVGPTPDTIDFDNPYSITTTTTYSDSSAPGERYYAVRAQDDAANRGPPSRVVGKYDVKLEEGYNLVSLPLVPFDNDIDVVMHQGTSYHPVIEIIRWNGSSQGFESTTFSNIQWHPFGFQELEYGRGYFFGADLGTTFAFVGLPPQETPRMMRQGMNLIGATDRIDQEISDLIVQDTTDIKASQVANRGPEGEYTIMSYDGSWRNQFAIEPGKGYWLKAEQEFMI